MQEGPGPEGSTGNEEGAGKRGRLPGNGARGSRGELPEEDRDAAQGEREREPFRACPLTHVLRLSCHPLREVASPFTVRCLQARLPHYGRKTCPGSAPIFMSRAPRSASVDVTTHEVTTIGRAAAGRALPTLLLQGVGRASGESSGSTKGQHPTTPVRLLVHLHDVLRAHDCTHGCPYSATPFRPRSSSSNRACPSSGSAGVMTTSHPHPPGGSDPGPMRRASTSTSPPPSA